MVVRRAERSDYLAIAALDREVCESYPNGANLTDGEHVWRHWVADAIVHVLCQDEKVVGVAIAFPRLDGGFWLHKIFILAAFRKKGGGRLLMEASLAEIDKLQADVWLTVSPANEHAVKLYRSYGFEADAITPAYYRDDEPRFEMRRRS